jgi:hypothetical protein
MTAVSTNSLLQTLTLGEVAKIEELSGLSMSAIGDDDAPKGAVLAAFVFVIKRRTDREFTWNAANGVTLPEAMALMGGTPAEDEPAGDPADPTPPADEPAAATE